MSVWLAPPQDLSAAARGYRERWQQHWPGADPQSGGPFPERVRRTLSLHRGFRSPLSAAAEVDAAADFARALLTRLAAGDALAVSTFDWEWSVGGRIGHERFTAVPGLERDRWLDLAGDAADTHPDPPVLTHVHRTAVAADDPQLAELTLAAARGVPITVTDEAVNWVARLDEDVVDLHALDPATFDTAEQVRTAVASRWGLDLPRHPLVDLAVVDQHIRSRQTEWRRRGVRVSTGPQYRSWPDDTVVILDRPPEDWADVDWLLVGLSTGPVSATVIAHDAGSCTVLLDRDESGETSVRHRERAGTLDVGGVIATLEAVVAALAGRASSTGPDR